MLRRVKDILGHEIRAKNGYIGKCKDFLFDDEHWYIRYMVADTGNWLPGRKVLISPIFLGIPDWKSKCFPVALTKEKIESSPPLEADAPVSRRYELDMHKYFCTQCYWGGLGPWGGAMDPAALQTMNLDTPEADIEFLEPEAPEECHLRSVKEVVGYRIQARDEAIGHVEGFLMDDLSWNIKYLIIDTRNIFPGKKVLISPDWASDVDWGKRSVNIDTTSETIRSSPKYDEHITIDRNYEQALYDHHRLPVLFP